MQNTQKNVFLTDDFRTQDWDSGNIDRYEYTENLDEFLNFLNDQENLSTAQQVTLKELSDRADQDGFVSVAEEVQDLTREWDALYDEWCGGDETRSIPMMNCLRYFPSFVSFDLADRFKVSGSTCLLYDNELEAWAVGMTGGGMDLSPHLLATFINLGKGVPTELASSIRRDYNAYVNKEEHEKNCDLLADAYDELSEKTKMYAQRLRK